MMIQLESYTDFVKGRYGRLHAQKVQEETEQREAVLKEKLAIDDEFREIYYVVLYAPQKVKWSIVLTYIFDLPSSNYWKYLILITSIINYMLVVTSLFFTLPISVALVLLLFGVFDLMYMIDLIILFLHRFWKNLENHTKPVKTSMTALVFDVISLACVPLGVLLMISYNKDFLKSNAYMITRLVTTLRLRRLGFFISILSEVQEHRIRILCSIITILVLVFQHTATLIWYYLGCYSRECAKSGTWLDGYLEEKIIENENDTLTYYVISFYAIGQISTQVGIRDVQPLAASEKVWYSLSMLFGEIFYRQFLMCILIAILSNRQKLRFQFVTQLNSIDFLLKQLKSLSKENYDFIMNYYQYLWEKKRGIINSSAFVTLPMPLQMELMYDVNYVPLNRSMLFRGLDESHLRALSLLMKQEFLLPGDIIYHLGVVKTFMVVVLRGVVELLSPEDDESPIIAFQNGTVLGEASLFFSLPSSSTVRATVYTEIAKIERVEFLTFMKNYPTALGFLRSLIENRIWILSVKKVSPQRRPRNMFIKCLKQRENLLNIESITFEDEKSTCNETFFELYHVSYLNTNVQIPKICLNQNCPYIIEGNSSLVTFMEILILSAHMCFILAYLYDAIFERTISYSVTVLRMISDIISVWDLILLTCTTIITRDVTIISFKNIMFYQMKSFSFYLYFIPIFPYEYFIQSTDEDDRLPTLLLSLKLFRIIRCYQIVNSIQNKYFYNSFLFVAIKLVSFCLLIIYFCACLLYVTTCFLPTCSTTSWFYHFILDALNTENSTLISFHEKPISLSLFFSTSLFFGYGFSKVNPYPINDIYIAMAIIFLGVFAKATLFSNLSVRLSLLTIQQNVHNQMITSLQRFLVQNKISLHIQKRVKHFLDLQWEYDRGSGQIAFEKTAPAHIVNLPYLKDMMEQLRTVPLFNMVNVDFLVEVIRKASKIIMLAPDSEICYKGDITREMFIIKHGLCAVEGTSQNNIDTLGPGKYFGDMEMIFGLPKLFTVRTLTCCKVICVNYSAYMACLSSFPKEFGYITTAQQNKSIQQSLAMVHKRAAREITDTAHLYIKKKHLHQNKFSIFCDGFKHIFTSSFTYIPKNYKNYLAYWSPFKTWGVFSFFGFFFMPICIHPDGLVLKVWVFLKLLLLMGFGVLSPFTLAAPPSGKHFFPYIMFVELVGYIDLYLCFHIGYFNEDGLLISHPKHTIVRYLSHSFARDLIGVIPFYYLIAAWFPDHLIGSEIRLQFQPHWQYCRFRLITFFQFLRYAVLFKKRLNKSTLISGLIPVISLKIVVISLAITYYVISVCGYEFTNIRSNSTERRKSEKIQRLANGSLCYGYLTCAGDIFFNPRHNAEDPRTVILKGTFYILDLIFVIGQNRTLISDTILGVLPIMFFYGAFIKVFLLSLIYSKIVKDVSHSVGYERKLIDLLSFLKNENISTYLVDKVSRYFEYNWRRTHGLHAADLLSNLNTALAEDIGTFLYEDVLRKVPLFEDVDLSFVRVIAKHLEEGFYLKDDKLINCSDVHSTIYIIKNGQVNIYDPNAELIATLGIGGIFGNIQNIAAGRSTVSVIAKRDLDVLIISSEKFFNILSQYPKIRNNLFVLLENAGDFLIPTFAGKDNFVVETIEFEIEHDNEVSLHNLKEMASLASRSLSSSKHDLSKGAVSEPSFILRKDSKQSRISIGSRKDMQFYRNWVILLFLNPFKWFRFSVHPDDPIIHYFNTLVAMCSYYTISVIPFLAINHDKTGWIFWTSLMIEPIFYYRPIIHLHTAFILSQNFYVRKNNLIAKRYFKNRRMLFWDIVPNIPFCLLALLAPAKQRTSAMAFLRLWQLLRIKYLNEYFSTCVSKLMANHITYEVIRLMMIMILSSHYLALLHYTVLRGTNYTLRNDIKSARNEMYRYAYSFYYILNLSTRTGLGDIQPISNVEVIVSMACVLISEITFFFMIYKILSIILRKMHPMFEYELQVLEMKTHFENLRLSKHQMTKFWLYTKKLWSDDAGVHMPIFLDLCPYNLRCDIMYELFGETVHRSYLLKGASTAFIKQMCFYLKRTVFFRGNYIVQHGDTTASMFWIHRGEVSVLTVHPNLTETRYEILDRRDMFGSMQGLFYGIPWHFSYRAESRCYILMLPLESWDHVLQLFPSDKELIYQRLHERYSVV